MMVYATAGKPSPFSVEVILLGLSCRQSFPYQVIFVASILARMGVSHHALRSLAYPSPIIHRGRHLL